MVDHVAVWGRVRAPGRAALGLDLQPRLAQRLGEVVVHRARDGHRVCYRLRLLVVLSQTAAKMLLDNRVADCVSWGRKNEGLVQTEHVGLLYKFNHISNSFLALFTNRGKTCFNS